METPRSKQFVVDHTFVSAVILAIAVACVTVLITLVLTGDLRQTDSNVSARQPAAVEPIPQPIAGTANFGNLDRLDQNPDMMVWKASLSETGTGLTDQQFIQQNTIRAKSTAYD
jgi:hypothetical protein